MNWRIVRPLIAAVLIFGAAGSRSVVPLSALGLDYLPGPIIEEPPGPYTGHSYVGPPENVVNGHAAFLSTFSVTYNGFTAQAQAAFQAAVDIWASQVQSTVPIRITANWTALGANVLSSAGPKWVFRDFARAPNANTYFAAATAKKISGVDLTAGLSDSADIVANFNSSFDWYLGTDGNAGTSYDLMTVVLHELAHGLGLIGSMSVSDGAGSWGLSGSPLIYDVYPINDDGQALLNTRLFPNPSTGLGRQLVSDSLRFAGAYATSGNGALPVWLHAPTTWSPGSSYSHLDERLYPAGTPNSLMTPVLGRGEAIHDLGPFVRGMLRDVGWGQVFNQRTVGDFDGDSRADVTIYRPSAGAWYVLRSNTSNATHDVYGWGSDGDVPVRGDFDGDRKADLAVFRPSSGAWYILRSSTGFTRYDTYSWGGTGDIPVPDDYDGDGKTDIALFRPSSGMWYILQSSTGFTVYGSYQWGGDGDVPVPGDFDGDGKADLGLYRPSAGAWYFSESTSEYRNHGAYAWGVSGDVPVPGDYDGDGRVDIAVYRPSMKVWLVLRSSTNYTASSEYYFGVVGDVPIPGDFDGDGKTDVAIYRPANGDWYILLSSTGYSRYVAYAWGMAGDIPVFRRP